MNIKQSLGFTLLELMIVVAIIGIIASMAVPSFQSMLERNRLKEAAESLKSDLMFARTESIKQSRNIIVNRSTGDNGAWCYGMDIAKDYDADGDIDNDDGGCDCTEADDTEDDYCSLKIVLGNSSPQTNIKSVFDADTTFDFRRGTSANANTCFSTTNYTVKVKTSNAGRTVICTNNNSTALAGIDACPNSDSVCAL